jgi:hypothetical protein
MNMCVWKRMKDEKTVKVVVFGLTSRFKDQ